MFVEIDEIDIALISHGVSGDGQCKPASAVTEQPPSTKEHESQQLTYSDADDD